MSLRRDLRALALVVATASSGCASSVPASAQAPDPSPVAGDAVTGRAAPVIVDGQAQIVPAFQDPSAWIRQELWVETEFDSDGDGRLDRMHVDVTRPAQTDSEGLRVPIIYETSPYYAGTGSPAREFFWDIRQELGGEPRPRNPMPAIPYRGDRPVISNSQVAQWVPRGFAVVHSESPGTGLSQGCPTVGADNESLAPKAVIDWLNRRARGYTAPVGGDEVEAYWSTGRVGMTGTSYNGTLPIAAATTGVEGLEAIIPVAPNTSYYHYYRSNGLVRSPGGWPGEDVDVLYDFINSGDPERRDYCARTVRDGEMAEGRDRVTGDYNEFWAGRDYLNDIGGVRAATLMSHAFNDWNVMPEHSYRIYDALRARGVPVQAYYHQGGHGGPPPHELMNRWFTRFVLGVDNGVENDPRAWIVREHASDPTPYPDFPHPDAASVRLHPVAGGLGVGLLSTDRPSDSTTESLVDDVTVGGSELAALAESPGRLLYATPELARAVHISGVPRVTVRLAANRSAANLSVWLVSLPWTERERITDNLITRGWADPQNHRSLTDGEPLEPGRFYDVTFDLQPDDQVVPAGERIGLMIFSSDPDFTLLPEPGTELTIDLAGTSLELPVVGGASALARPIG